MTPIEGTSSALPHPSSTSLTWAIVLTGLISIVAVVVLSLIHRADAAATVGALGTTTVTALGGAQISARNRQ
ncbi:hypothetical protein OG985_48845 (plasmid) [Streptomyces sp. NBC_00289]|uniref:hypothetical protein n=1 Tax=Streptomyces sp. NBC_00289 TaxID=2975703 RepID=UPI0032443ACE